MLGPRVLDLVVTDAAERLHKHHGCGDTGTCDLSRVVQRPGRQPRRGACRFENRLLTQRDELGVKRNGLDTPDSRPLNRAAFECGEALTRCSCFAVQGREDLCVQVALVERSLGTADHRGDNAGEGFKTAHGRDRVRMFCRDGADLECKPRGRGKRIAAGVHGG